MIPEENKSKFGKITGLFRRKNKPDVTQNVESNPVPEEVEQTKNVESSEQINQNVDQPEQVETHEESEEKTKEYEKLKQKYGVTKDIPKRKIEESYEETEKKSKENYGGDVNLPQLILRIEKLDGKIDMLNQFKNEANERVTQLAEEIGELRSMIMERERSFDKMSTSFEVVKDTVSGLQPNKIKKEFEKRETEIMENKAKLETLETLVKELSAENKKFRQRMDKIKSFENLVELSYDMDRKVSEMKEIKAYADMIASKVESIFSELNQKVSQLENQREKIDKIDELTIEMTKMLDDVSVKLTKFVTEKDLKDLKKTIEEDIKKMYSGKMPVLEVKGDTNINTVISDLSSRISKLRSVVEGQNVVINKIIKHLEGKTEVRRN